MGAGRPPQQSNTDLARYDGGPFRAVVKTRCTLVKNCRLFWGMDKAEALAYVSRLFDAAAGRCRPLGRRPADQAVPGPVQSAPAEGDPGRLPREIREFVRWRDRNHPHLHLREINPAFCQDWVSQLREQVEAGLMKPRTFNRRIAAISSLYRWAAEPSRSAVTGVPRNPMPPRSLLPCREEHAGPL